MRPALQDFVEPNWKAPLDLNKALGAIPDSVTIAGMFLEPAAREAREKGRPLPSSRDRYVAFRFYPLREHAQLLIEACGAYYPDLPIRIGLRKLGRAGPNAFLASTLGRVSIGSAHGTHDLIDRLAKSYSINMPGTQVDTVEIDATNAVVRMQNVFSFVDCHHVGVFEGVMRYAGVQGEVKIKSYNAHSADLWCSWR